MPELSATVALGEPFAKTIFLSSITNSDTFNVTVLPCTVRSPCTSKSLTITFESISASKTRVLVKYRLDDASEMFAVVNSSKDNTRTAKSATLAISLLTNTGTN